MQCSQPRDWITHINRIPKHVKFDLSNVLNVPRPAIVSQLIQIGGGDIVDAGRM